MSKLSETLATLENVLAELNLPVKHAAALLRALEVHRQAVAAAATEAAPVPAPTSN